MSKLKKKGTEGTAANYITRNRALKKLQLSLHSFRRLCILKGIYPRDPKHKNKIGSGTGTNKKTVYLLKDIQFLSHEPLLVKFRALRAFQKRIKKYIGRAEWSRVRSLEKNARPEIKLDHLVRERYPSFVDALRDIDDPLSMLALFAHLPRTGIPDHQADVAKTCERLMREFEAYVIASDSLRKTFISIKGIYYQANIMGQTVTWVVPHEFTTPIPTDVDYKIMLTFLEFYMVLMKFVNFRLFSRLGWDYPQKFISETQETLVKETFPPITNPEEIFPSGEDKRPLSNAKVYISREVPKKALSFLLQCLGAEIHCAHTTDDEKSVAASFAKEDDPSITLQIIDRPAISRMFVGRQYVQPQWVFDSLNAGELVDMTNYHVGATLPSHLSPFQAYGEEDEDFGKEEQEEEEEKAEGENNNNKENTVAGGKTTTTTTTTTSTKNKNKKTLAQKELAVSMLSKKRQKLYKVMQGTRQRELDAKEKLQAKRKAVKAKAAATADANN